MGTRPGPSLMARRGGGGRRKRAARALRSGLGRCEPLAVADRRDLRTAIVAAPDVRL